MSLAIVAGRGRLPALLAEAAPGALICAVEGAGREARPDVTFRVETLGTFLRDLRGRGVARVCLAGAIARPELDPARVDAATAPILPGLMAAAAGGDDAALRAVIGVFEAAGLEVVAPDAVRPDLLPPAGLLAGALAPRDEADAARAAAILAALAPVDVGQGCVVAGGLCLAVEALPGTDHMLGVVAGLARRARAGLLLKAPKAGQDRRVDLPTIGPGTIRAAARAGLSGIAVEAGGVLVLDADACAEAATMAGLFLWVRPCASS